MHIPDGFINGGTSAAAGLVAAGGVGVSMRKTNETLRDRQVPLCGLVAAYVFAVQMLNFPVANGTSGHLLGGVLAAVLVGPWAGVLCITVVLVIQALVFADGGLSALGLSVVNMALLGTLGGFAVFRLLRAFLPPAALSVTVSSGVAAAMSVPLASLGFVVEYAIGGAEYASVTAVFTAMTSVHVLIGIGEGVITALTVGAVMAVRPDLVFGASDLPPRVPTRAASATSTQR